MFGGTSCTVKAGVTRVAIRITFRSIRFKHSIAVVTPITINSNNSCSIEQDFLVVQNSWGTEKFSPELRRKVRYHRVVSKKWASYS